MAHLSDHIENALNEARMLLLGGQVLLGFSYRMCFEPRFQQINTSAQLAEIVGLGIMTAGLGWLIWPAAFHQIAARGLQTARMETFSTRVLDWALFPMACGLALTFYPVNCALQIPHPVLISVAAGLFAVAVWYGSLLSRDNLEHRRQAKKELVEEQQKPDPKEEGNLSDRIKKVLVECRMALPGAQAFLGFQFAIVFGEGFDKLPRSSQWVHFASLLATTVAIVLLIAPAAYHRLVEAGQDSEHFHTVASRLLLASLIFLAPGMAGDLLVVIRKFTGSDALAYWSGGGLLLAFYFLWFGISLWKRTARK